jgi:Double-GTPase 1
MSGTEASVALIGMPETGKSTYIAALYHELTEAIAGSRARLLKQPTNRVYLEELRQAWLAGEPVGRTPPDNGEVIDLLVGIDDRSVALTIPDIAGESFEGIFVRRQVDRTIESLVRDASGLLLFTHPDHVRPRMLISQAKKVADLIGEAYVPPPLKEFDPLEVPGEVQLVDLLQWTESVRTGRSRLGLIVSAWDRCAGNNTDTWLDSKMPMLKSFLRGHSDTFEVKVFGVSAQGGTYGGNDDPSTRRPYDRAYVVGDGDKRSTDLTELLAWVAFG